MSGKAGILASLVAVAVGGSLPASAQSNLDAGKSPAQIFAATCNACHRSPREIRRTNAAFLREHYTTGPREAAAMAAYLASVGSDPTAVQHRRPPTLGAGQQPAPGETATAAAPATGTAASEQPEAGNAQTPGEREKAAGPKPRRPSESIEFGVTPPAQEEGVAVASPAAPAAPQAGLPSSERAASKLEIEE